jgi:hypothetical protein
MQQTFPAPVVRELRDQAKRYRVRARNLELVLIRREIANEAARAGIDPSAIPPDALARVFVDDAGVVRGAAEAVAFLKP